jgi:hypothetical protein
VAEEGLKVRADNGEFKTRKDKYKKVSGVPKYITSGIHHSSQRHEEMIILLSCFFSKEFGEKKKSPKKCGKHLGESEMRDVSIDNENRRIDYMLVFEHGANTDKGITTSWA